MQTTSTPTLNRPAAQNPADDAKPGKTPLASLREYRGWLLPLLPLIVILYVPLQWCWSRWSVSDSPQSYQPLVPLAAAYLVWLRRAELARVPRVPGERPLTSLWLVMVGCGILLLGHAIQLVTLPMFGFVVTLAGMVLYLYGRAMLSALAVPILFLLTMVPLPDRMLAGWTQQLQMLSTQGAGHVLSNLGYENQVVGNLVLMKNFQLDVIAPCSGVSILFPVLVMTLWLSLIRRSRLIPTLTALTIAGVIALMMNVLRITAVGVVGASRPSLAHTLHDPISWAFTALAFYVTFVLTQPRRPRKAARPA